MATARYTRIDNNRGSSSGYCSKVTLVVFVALCLVGVWMLTSSSVVPVENTDLAQEHKNEANEQVTENKGSNTPPFEDNRGGLPVDKPQGRENSGQKESNSDSQDNQQEKANKKPEEKSTDESRDGSNGETGYGEKKKDDSDTKAENREQNSGTGDGKTDSNEDNGGRSENGSADKKSYTDESGTESKLDEIEKKSESHDSDKKSDSDDSESRSDFGDSEKKSDLDDNKKKSDLDDGENKSSSDDSEEKTDSDSDDTDKKSEDNSDETNTEGKVDGKIDEKVDQDDKNESKSDLKNKNGQGKNESSNEVFPSGMQAELLNETNTQSGSWSTQVTESKNENEAQKSNQTQSKFSWKLCNVTAGPDYIPCLDNWEALKHLRSTKHYEHRERHCPVEPPTCLVSLPNGYKPSIQWPKSRDKIWYNNVPHTKLAEIKGHQNWVKVTGEYLTFPGGGTQFKRGALHYIDFIQESLPDIAWGKRSRVVLDVGCGVASFGGYLFDRDVLTMSFAPKDEHEAQVQFALERGIPAISAVMGTVRLPFPGRVFDIVHCARCRVPWHIEGGKLLLELNRVLRPGGFFIWSATPIYQKLPEDVEIWQAMKNLTRKMCWETMSIVKDKVNRVGIAIYKKPTSNGCYTNRSQNEPPICSDSDDPNAAWNVTLQACMHKVPVDPKERGSKWPEKWPERLSKTPYWLQSSQTGVYGQPAPEDFAADYEHWKRVVSKSYLNGMGINWSTVRNVMDMRAVYGGFAAALKDLNIWVMNVVNIDSADTLPVIYERGLFGIYHDWCESFSTYPRSYDLLHADHLFSRIKKRCNLVALIAEVDRILRPEGKLIVRDDVETITEVESMVKSLHWDVRLTFSKEKVGLLCVQKMMWRPKESETLTFAIA